MIRRIPALAALSLLLAPLLTLVGALAGASPAVANDLVVQLDPEATEVTFVLGATGHDVHGTFGFQEGVIRFDPATGEASGELVVDAAAAQTGNDSRDKTMHNKVLESDQFPEIVFHVERVEGTLPDQGKGSLQLLGTMEIHGSEHRVTMPAEVERTGDTVHAKTHFDVPFVDWGMHDPSILFLRVEKNVAVSVDTEGHVSEASSAMDADGMKGMEQTGEADQGGR